MQTSLLTGALTPDQIKALINKAHKEKTRIPIWVVVTHYNDKYDTLVRFLTHRSALTGSRLRYENANGDYRTIGPPFSAFTNYWHAYAYTLLSGGTAPKLYHD